MPADPLIVAWVAASGTRCVVAHGARWEVVVEREGIVLARRICSTASKALAAAEEWHDVFGRE